MRMTNVNTGHAISLSSKNRRTLWVMSLSLRAVAALLLITGLSPTLAQAEVVVTRLGVDAYSIRMEADVAAPAVYVRALLTDYAHLNRVNPAIRESRLLGAFKPAQQRVRTVTRSCAAFVCFDMVQVQDVLESAGGEIIVTTVPEQSDFKEGIALWHILPTGNHTHVVFEARMRPAFWVPPVIGTWMLERQINQQLELTVRNLTRLGNQLALR